MSLDICQNILERANKKGIDNCDVILQKGDNLSISVLEGEIDKYETASSHVVGIRVIHQNKIGMAYSESFLNDSLDEMIDMAMANSQAAEFNNDETICFSDNKFEDKDQVLKDDSTIEEKIKTALRLEADVRKKDHQVKSIPHNELGTSYGEYFYLNSKNVTGQANRQYFSCYTSAFYENSSNSSLALGSTVAHQLNDLDIDYCVNKAVFNGTQWLNAKKLETGDYDIIFDTNILSQIFYTFSNIYSGKELVKGVNPFKDKVGEVVIGAGLSIVDDSSYKDNFYKSFYDDEGCVQKPLSLIEEGKLKNFIHNSATAKYFNTKSTGHAVRGPKSPLSVGLNNLIITGGDLSDDGVRAGKYFEIHKLQGLGSGANTINGEFSAAASGYFCENGQILFPVKGVTISGNFHKMMREIEICGKKLHASNAKRFFSPLIKFKNIRIAS